MRRLYPEPADSVDPADAYAVANDSPRHLRVNMISSADGAATTGGRVGGLTSTADQALLHLLRALADVVLVGAGTIRAEGYGPVELPGQWQRRRVDRGQLPNPPLALLTRRLDLDLAAPLFTEAVSRPLILTSEAAPAERRKAAGEVAELIVIGEEYVDLPAAMDALVARGLVHVLSEGGPHMLSGLFAADLVDELCLAVAPVVTGGDDMRITSGPRLSPPKGLQLRHVLEEEQFLFLRYVRQG